ncbi:MAG: MFS transporter [Bauldia sp.]
MRRSTYSRSCSRRWHLAAWSTASPAPAGSEAAIPAWIPLAVGVVAMAAFVARQIQLQAHDKALLDLRTFASRDFTISVTMFVIMMMAIFGTIILLPIYMQNVRGLSTLQTGLLLMPGGLLMGLLGPYVGRVYDCIGPRPLVVPGAIAVSAVLWAMIIINEFVRFVYACM